MNSLIQPRLVETSLERRLSIMPAVVVTGARQTGKSTLVRDLAGEKRQYFSLDDLDVVDAARRDPASLLGGQERVRLDEVQREPELLHAVKLAIDRERTRGRFLLTGSANLLLKRGISESQAGRASYPTLWPMTRCEQRGLGRCGLWEELLSTPEKEWPEILAVQSEGAENWQAFARRGGFPTPAISALPDFRRLMRACSLRLGQVGNQTEIGRDLGLPQPTVHRYLNLLETSYMLVRLPAYAVNRTKRLIKSPKLYWSDTGVALYLSGGPEPAGAHLENLVLGDLLAFRDTRLEQTEILYWRTTVGEEVDLVIEADGWLLPIEVKATTRPRLADAAHIRTFRSEYPEKSLAGLLLHTGTKVEWLAPDVLAAPWWRVV